MTRRELLALAVAAPVAGTRAAAFTKELPTAPVAIAKVPSYDADLVAALDRMFDQIGGAGKLVRNKTVAIKLNLTGSPGQRFQGRPLGNRHASHSAYLACKVLTRSCSWRQRVLETFHGGGATGLPV